MREAMRGLRMGYAWAMHGLCVGYARAMHGLCVGYAWALRGLCVGSPVYAVTSKWPAPVSCIRRFKVWTIADLPVPPAPTTSVTADADFDTSIACAICCAESPLWMPFARSIAASRKGRAPARCSTLSGGSPTGCPARFAAWYRAAAASYSASVIGANGSCPPSPSAALVDCRYQTVASTAAASPSGRTCCTAGNGSLQHAEKGLVVDARVELGKRVRPRLHLDGDGAVDRVPLRHIGAVEHQRHVVREAGVVVAKHAVQLCPADGLGRREAAPKREKVPPDRQRQASTPKGQAAPGIDTQGPAAASGIHIQAGCRHRHVPCLVEHLGAALIVIERDGTPFKHQRGGWSTRLARVALSSISSSCGAKRVG